MQRRQFLRWGLGCSAWAASAQLMAKVTDDHRLSAPEKLIWRERAMVGFGTTLWLKAAHENADQLEAGLNAAVQAIRRVEHQMSLFDPDSALSRLNARGHLQKPDAELLAVLRLSQHVSAKSAGAFDMSMQPLWTVWSESAESGRLPLRSDVQRAQQLVNWRAVEISGAAVRLNQSGMRLSLNGIAQGYASDLARAALQAHGIQHALIDAGETTLLGHAAGDKQWALAIESAAGEKSTHNFADKLADKSAVKSGSGKGHNPMPVLICDGRAIATSSDAHTVFSADHKHHHILNPQSGYSPAHWSSVTVIAPSCVLADALTKVFFMLPPSQVLSAAHRWGVDVVLQDKAGKWVASDGAGVNFSGLAYI